MELDIVSGVCGMISGFIVGVIFTKPAREDMEIMHKKLREYQQVGEQRKTVK